MTGPTTIWRRKITSASILLLLIIMVTAPAKAALGNPGVLPPNSKPFGMSYGDWSAKWWQWAFSIPNSKNPLLDDSGVNCSSGQSGKVWFLGGTFAVIETGAGELQGTAVRHCKIPVGKAILFPVLISECSVVEGNGTTDQELRTCAKSSTDHVTFLTTSIDGVQLDNLTPSTSLGGYRVQSPMFNFTLPADNLLGTGSAGTSLSVSDGYWIMLAPLSAGTHTIHFAGSADFSADYGFIFSLDITYHLQVVKR